MKEQINAAIELIKKQDINGCITGSVMLEYFEGQDIDVFVYSETDLNKLLFYMYYNSMFTILEPLEKYKFEEYINKGKSSLHKMGLITIKMKYNLCVDVNVVYRKSNSNIFDVLSNFDLSIIAKGYDIKTGKTLDLSDYKNDKIGSWNKWNRAFYQPDIWDVKRFIRQFLRIIKYTERGYNLTEATEKYLSMIEEILNINNIYKSEKGIDFYERTQKEFKVVSDILKIWQKEQKMSEKHKLFLQTII